MNTLKKMYVLVRKDLSETYRNVQGGHALIQYALDHPDLLRAHGNGTLVYLGIPNLIALRNWKSKLTLANKPFSCFYEPDLDGHETAIVCYDEGPIFRRLPIA